MLQSKIQSYILVWLACTLTSQLFSNISPHLYKVYIFYTLSAVHCEFVIDEDYPIRGSKNPGSRYFAAYHARIVFLLSCFKHYLLGDIVKIKEVLVISVSWIVRINAMQKKKKKKKIRKSGAIWKLIHCSKFLPSITIIVKFNLWGHVGP